MSSVTLRSHFYLPAISRYLTVGLLLNETVLAFTEMTGWSYNKVSLHIPYKGLCKIICVCWYACSAVWMYCILQLMNT